VRTPDCVCVCVCASTRRHDETDDDDDDDDDQTLCVGVDDARLDDDVGDAR